MLPAEQRGLERPYDRFRDFVLNRENIFQLAIVALGPQVVAVGDIDELCCDAKPLSRTADASFENCFDIELSSNLANVEIAAPEAECRRARDHAKAAQARQCIDQLFGQSVAEIFLLCVGART